MAAHAMAEPEASDLDARRTVRPPTAGPGGAGASVAAEPGGQGRTGQAPTGPLRPSQVPVPPPAPASAGHTGDRDLDDPDGSRRAPSEVADVLRSPGTPLDAGTRTVMERAFGADFRPVRVHTDRQAAASAAAIGADAYTVGRHIAFGPGRYQSGTEAGRRLLAHELAHVVQQQGRSEPGGDLRIGSPRSADETDARRAAGSVPTTAVVLPAATPRTGSLAATGVRGSARPAGAERAARRPSAVTGPAVVRRAPSTGPRELTAAEVDLLKGVYGTHLDTSLIRIHENSLLATGAKRTIGNTINIQGTTISSSTLIHEAAHCYQNQRGDHYVASSLFAQGLSWVTSGSRAGAYDYTDEVAKKVPFDDWNSEQQAHWIEDNRQLPPSRRGATGYP